VIWLGDVVDAALDVCLLQIFAGIFKMQTTRIYRLQLSFSTLFLEHNTPLPFPVIPDLLYTRITHIDNAQIFYPFLSHYYLPFITFFFFIYLTFLIFISIN